MDNNIVQFVGAPCGQHGPYTFYKAFKYKKNGLNKIVTLSEFFFVKLWMDSDLLCIGELQLLWIDKNSEQVLASLRLYFLPENTPEGRMDHGEDEVLAIAEKVVLRVEDLVTWITVDAEWTWGRLGTSSKQVKEPPDGGQDEGVPPVSLSESSLDFSDVEKDRKLMENEEEEAKPSVVILSYPRYCRYRAMMRRLEGVENEYLKYNIVKALGGFSFKNKNTRVMFCRDTFEYPELEGHEMLCNHLAPKLKGRPRGKRKKRSVSPGSESNESESSVSTSFNTKVKTSSESSSSKNGLLEITIPRRSTRSTDNSETKEFMKKLTAFMKMKKTPLGRAPCLGFKEIDLYDFYNKVQKLGGYDAVTSNRLWKSIFDEMNGHQNSTGAATIVRRHYERFLLSYERHLRGEEYKPLPVSERRRLKTKSCSKIEPESNKVSDAGDEQSNSPPTLVAPSNTPSLPSSADPCDDSKEISPSLKQEGKTSALRSVRVKPERQNNKFAKVVKMEDITLNSDSLRIIKVEMKTEEVAETEIKNEKVEVKVEAAPVKEPEPVTSAVAPIVQKIASPEKTPSPVECKENIPLLNTGETASTNDKEIVINVPCNQNSIKQIEMNILQTVDVDSGKPIMDDAATNNFANELKKGKLDILKEGGLEVTPVRTYPSPIKDSRPSVIHNMMNTQATPKVVKTDPQMPPPSQTLQAKRLPINIPQSLNISKVSVPITTKPNAAKSPLNNTFAFPAKTPSTPPKVVQSRSIYSYSEKTVYGNPKDCLVGSYPVHTPKAPVNLKKQTGGDLLDLTVTSPQKPFVDMRIPTIPSTAHSSNYGSLPVKPAGRAATLPIFEGRKLGSNLEITLVDSSTKTPTHFQQTPKLTQSQHLANAHYAYKPHHKRSISESATGSSSSTSTKVQKIEENGKYSKPSTSSSYGRVQPIELNVQHQQPYGGFKPHNSNNTPQLKSYPEAVHNSKNYPTGVAFPHYLSHLYEGNKGITPYFPMIDPLLYSAAMQGLYPQSGMNPSPQFLQFATQDQLKLYGELMAQNSRIPFPFQLPSQDGEFAHNAKKS